MATTTRATLRRSDRFGLCTLAVLTMLALIGNGASPALALSRTGVVVPGTGVKVAPPDPCLPQPTVNFATSASMITFGQPVTLSWTVQVPSGCSYVVALLGQSMPPQGSMQVYPLGDTTYTITLAWGPTQTLYTTKAVTVWVGVPADPSDPNRNLITITSQAMMPMFVKALGTPNTTVVVPNGVAVDLSGLPNQYNSSSRVVIRDGVRLIGGRVAAPGQPFQPGPLLFVTDLPDHLFEVQGDNVHVSGVRIQGPIMDVSSDVGSTAILVGDVMPSCGPQNSDGTWPVCPTPAAGHINVEIDHNEFSGWSVAALDVRDAPGRINVTSWIDSRSIPVEVGYALTTEPVYIHDNFFHHNQHISQLGYGVALGYGAHALIERNVFDWNRHAITADGTSRTGYRAYRNLVLENGGLNADVLALVHQYTQQFDMHGVNDECLTFFGIGCATIGDHYVGQAGHDYDVRYNSFLYTAGPAIKLRGTPELGLPGGAVMRFNVFAHALPVDTTAQAGSTYATFSGAVEWTQGAPVVQDNLTSRTTYNPIATCDFDGDGINDTFIATEQTMWYCPGPGDCVTAPGSGKPTWVFLNSSTKPTNQLSLGFFSGGAVCDVADGSLVSVGGWGSWRMLTKARSGGFIPAITK